MDLTSLKGWLVDIFYRDKIYPAYVKEVKGKRLLVYLPTGKEESISHSALVCVGAKVGEKVDLNSLSELFKSAQALREELKSQFNLEELWEVVKGELTSASPDYLVELYLGRKPKPDEVCAFLRLILEEKLYFRFKSFEEVEVLSEEEVKNILHQREKEREKELLREGFKDFLQRLSEGKVTFNDEGFLSALKQFVIFENEQALSKDLYNVLSEHNLAQPQKVFSLLVKAGVFKEDENLELLKFGFPREFSQASLSQAEECLRMRLEDLPHFDRFKDLTHLETYAVDAPETQDVDDAFSIEDKGSTTTVYVHIADVSSFIPIGSPLFEEALERASTLYMPDEVIPMLPFSLSHDKFSLLEGELRSSLTFKIELREKPFEVLSFEVVPAIIKVKKRFTYEEVDTYLEEGHPFWKSLYSLLLEHKKKRQAQGAFAIILPEVQVRVLEDGEIVVSRFEMTPARDLISELMILTNHLSAKFCYEAGLPIIYRKQDPPFQVFPEAEGSLFYKLLQLRYFARSELTTEPGFHSGLGLNFYTTLTSPIRRSLDLVVHHQIKSHLFSEKALSQEDLQRLIPELEENFRRAQAIQQKRVRYFLLKYLAKHYAKKEGQGEVKPLKGLVVEKKERLLKVYLPDFNLMGEVRGSFPQVNPGDEVVASLERVEPREELLLLSLL
jgi:exoribonuclease-2